MLDVVCVDVADLGEIWFGCRADGDHAVSVVSVFPDGCDSVVGNWVLIGGSPGG